MRAIAAMFWAPRWAFAALGLLFAGLAVSGALTHSAFAGRCLSGGPSWVASLGHCPWCYAALAALLLALSPWPRMRSVRI